MEAVLTKQELQRLRLRAVRRAKVRARNEPPRLTVGEEVFNAVSHGLGALGAAAALGLLLVRSGGAMERLATFVYGVSMVVMMLMSCVYHAMPAGSRGKRVLRRFDYTSIYLLIGGTFAPILLLYLGGTLGMFLFCVQWAVILSGVALVMAFGPGRWRALHFTLYFLIGWSGLVFLPRMYLQSRTLLWFIFAGGLAYTLGMIPFAGKRKYSHCVWHVFVLAGAALHWIGIYTQIYLPR
ncbi:MAG: hypothetical protein HFG05_07430 [Oscillibacter sp.]|nr:hypothetical protein [Oscillibacter sp.]